MILAIDVGLRNLSLCVMDFIDNEYKIYLWDVYNLLDDANDVDVKCVALTKRGKICDKICKFKCDGTYTCKQHAKKDGVLQLIAKRRVKDHSMQELAIVIIQKIEEMYENHKSVFDKISKILIELQPQFNPKMGFASHIIYGKFIDILRNNANLEIKFVRATQKSKVFAAQCPDIICDVKNAYAKRKQLSIKYATWFLSNHISDPSWNDRFDLCLKRDDLADTLCYCYAEFKTKKK